MKPWLHVVGIGEEGWNGLTPAVQAIVETAEVIIGGERHHALAPHVQAERVRWPSPFNAMIEQIKSYRGRRTVILVTGDPLWYSAGAKLAREIPAEEIIFYPHLSAFQLAAARMGWSLADVETPTVHGRPVEQVIPFFAPGARLIVLTQDETTPARIARMLTERGFGGSTITVFDNMGGATEQRHQGLANDWWAKAGPFNTACIDCVAGEDATVLPLTGLPDDAFEHDGKMTKQEMRMLTLAALAPRRGAMLWDIGAGCGSVAVEWMRAARDCRAIGLEPHAERRAMAARNALALGAPMLTLLDATAPDGLAGLPDPDAVFVGGGLSHETVGACLDRLPRHGRLVANAVTLESEALLAEFHAEMGGELRRVAVSRAGSIGTMRGWRPAMPVTQWVKVK